MTSEQLIQISLPVTYIIYESDNFHTEVHNFLKEENLEHLDIFKTQPGPVAKNATLGHPAGKCNIGPTGWPNVAFFATGPG